MNTEHGSEGDNASDSQPTNDATPIDILSEFLMAVMGKQYEKALQLCEAILDYEPNNATAKAFHMLIVERLALKEEEEASTSDGDGSEDDETERSNESSEFYSEATSQTLSSSEDEDDGGETSSEEEGGGPVATSTPTLMEETPAFSSSGSDSSIAPGPSKETVDGLRSRVVTVKKTDNC